jgi:hypothetical protein
MSLSGVNAGYLDVRNAILRVGTLDVQTIVSGVDTATNIAKTNTILLWDDQGSDMNSPPFILTSATRSTSPPYLELGGGVAHVGIKLPNAWLGAFEVYMSDTTDASIKLHTYTTDTTSYGDTGYELVLNSSGVTLNYDGAQVATGSRTWTNDTWHQVVVGFERGAWTVSVDGTPTLIKDDIEREAVYANVGQYLRIDAASATTTKRVRYVKFAANGQWLQSNTGALSYTQGNVGIGVTNPARTFHVRGQSTVWRLDRDRNSAALHMHRFPTGDWTAPWKGYALGVDASGVDTGEFFIGDYGTAVSGGQTRRLTIDNTGNVIIGTQSTGSHLLEVYGTANTGTLTTTSASITDVTHSTSKDTGALLVTDGGLGVESNIHSTNVFAASHVGVGTTATSYNLDVNGTANVGAITMNSNVYAPNLQVADTASNLVTWNSATGDFMDSGGLISNKLAIVSEQPPAALTAATTTVNGHGKYSVYASNVATNSNAWNAFDQSSSVYWQSTGVYSGGVGGEYLKITFPYKTTLRHVVYTGASGAYTSWAKAANIAGSNDDSTWTQLASFSGFGPTSNDPKTMIVNATTSYKHYKFTITENSGSVNYATVAQLKLFTESFSVDGGIVTTTAASGLETGFTEHPVAPMTDYNTYVEGHGTYEASVSSFVQWFGGFGSPFDKVIGSNNMWASENNWDSSNVYTNARWTTDVGGTRHYGEWLQLKLPYAITLAYSEVYPRTSYVERGPGQGVILGSNDGEHWYKLTEFSGLTYTSNEEIVQVNATTPYQYFRMTVNKLVNADSDRNVNVGEWRLFSATGVTKMDNVLISGELAVHGGALQTSHIKWPKVPLKANESEGYVASASSSDSAPGDAYRAFNDLTIGQGVEYWDTASTYSTSTGLHNNSVSTTDVDGLVQYGEWIQIKLPNQISLHSMKWYPRKYYASGDLESWPLQRVPKSGVIMGSNDGTNWYTLNSFSDISYTLAAYEEGKEVKVNNSKPFLYYRLVITSLNAGTGSNRAGLVELQLFESTLGVGTSATTAKLTVDGGLGLAKGSQVFAGSDVITEFPKHDRPLTKYPEVAMTAASTGGYVASASNNVGGRYPYDAFNNTNVDGNDCWQVVTESATDGYSDTDGTYTGSTRLSLSSNTPLGEWLKLESPIAFKLKSYKISARNSSAYYNSQAPRDAEIWGSNDDTNWTKITEHSGLEFNSQTDSSSFNVSDDNEKYFKYHAIIVTKNNADEFFAVSIGDWELYGTEEGDESVDVVHRSIPNKPGTQQLAVYYEARDSNSYSFADSSNVYDLSGNGVTGTITGNNGFDAEYNAWVFDGSGDYISGTLPSSASGEWVHSVSVWFRASIYTNQLMFIGNVEANNNRISLLLDNTGEITIGISGSNTIYGAAVSLDYVWHHLTYTYAGGPSGNGATGYNLYIDGVNIPQTDGVGSGTLDLPTGPNFFVGSGLNGGASFTGSIANFRLFGKALNADQVRELYDYDAERFGHRQNVVALHKGNLGVGVAHPTSRFEVAGADGLQEYPPRGITLPGASYNGTRLEEYIEGHGLFVVDGTSNYTASGTDDRRSWNMFEKLNTVFHCNGTYATTGTPAAIDVTTTLASSYSANMNFNTRLSSGGTIFADWVQLELPYKILLKQNTIKNHNTLSRSAAKGYIVASNDGFTFDVLNTIDDFGYTTTYQEKTFITNTNTYYRIYRLLFTHKVGGDDNFVLNMSEWRLFGTPAPSSLEDGHLTLGKALTAPRLSGHGAGAETPRAESLVVNYDTTVDSVVSGTTVVDISGQGNNGNLNGNATYSSTDRALTFDGTGDYVSGTLPSTATGAWVHTQSFWFKANNATDSEYLSFIGNTAVSEAIFPLFYSGKKFAISMYGEEVISTTVIENNKWYHAAITYIGGAFTSSNVNIYIDGTAVNTTHSATVTPNITIPNFSIAGRPNGGNAFDGSISNFKIWDVALTAEEVAMEYALGRTGKSINLTDTALCIGGTVPRAQLDAPLAHFDRLNIGPTSTNGHNPRTHALLATTTNGSNHSHLNDAWRDVWFHDYDENWNFKLSQYHDTGISVSHAFRWKHGGGTSDNYMTFKGGNVGIGTTAPSSILSVQGDISMGTGTTATTGVFRPSVYWNMYYDGTGGYARAFLENNNTWTLNVNGNDKMYIRPDAGVLLDNFTGQHRCFVDGVHSRNIDDYVGLVVCANKNAFTSASFNTYKGNRAIQMDETLPDVSLSKVARDKSCFGVISHIEDEEKREDTYGSITIPVPKELGDTRVYINSVGEGAMWVVNTAGPLESGDYITTSNVAGYGQRQDDDILHNYTVAKITMDCDFNPPDIPVQRILKELSNITYWYQLEDATSNAYDRTEEETYYTLDRRVEVHGHVDEQSNVFVEPVHDLELYTRTQQNVITEEVYNALPEDERVLYDSNTFTYTQVTELAPEVWADLDGEEQNTYVRDYFNIVTDEVPSETPGAVECTRTVYKKIVNETKVEPATPEDYFSEVRQEWVNVLDAHDQLQWEDVPWGETEPAYKVRYLDADGKITTRHNEVHRAAFVGVTYHCG